MKIPWWKVLAFSHFVSGFTANGLQYQGWLALHPEESKLRYAIKRVVDQIASLDKTKQVEFESIDIDNCATDADGIILRELNGGLRFTKDGLKARNSARADLLDAEVEIEPYYASEIPEMSDGDREVFTGFVVRPEEAEPEAVA